MVARPTIPALMNIGPSRLADACTCPREKRHAKFQHLRSAIIGAKSNQAAGACAGRWWPQRPFSLLSNQRCGSLFGIRNNAGLSKERNGNEAKRFRSVVVSARCQVIEGGHGFAARFHRSGVRDNRLFVCLCGRLVDAEPTHSEKNY